MTTTEMILALLDTGKFTLPRGVEYWEDEGWTLDNSTPEHRAPISAAVAHDLFALHVARTVATRVPVETSEGPVHVYALGKRVASSMWQHMSEGNTAGAIHALYDAMMEDGQ